MTRQAQLLAEGRSGCAPSPLTELPRLRIACSRRACFADRRKAARRIQTSVNS